MFGAFSIQRTVGAICRFASKDLKAKRVAFIAHDDDYGGGNPPSRRPSPRSAPRSCSRSDFPALTDVTAPLLKIRAANPDVMVFTAYPRPAVLIAEVASSV